jgi:hypothetical protein
MAIDPDSLATLNNAAGAYNEMAMVQLGRGLDVGPALDQCVALERHAIALESGMTPLWNTMALCHWVRAEEQSSRGVDPTPTVELVRDAARHGLAINPKSVFSYQALVQADMVAAEYELRRGGDPRSLLASAEGNGARALAINPEFPHLHATMGLAHAYAAEYLVDQGQDPATELLEGRRMVAAETRLNPKSGGQYPARARLEIAAARWAMRHGDSPLAALDAAQGALTALAVWSTPTAEQRLLTAIVHRWRAEWNRSRHLAVEADVERGVAAAQGALEINPKLAEAMAVAGALELLRSRDAEAERWLARAFELDPLLRREYGPLLDPPDARAAPRAAS